VEELQLLDELNRLPGNTTVRVWQHGANLEGAMRESEIVVTGWRGPPVWQYLQGWHKNWVLRLIAHTGGTLKDIVPFEATLGGLRVTHANRALTLSLAEFSLALMLAGRRQVIPSFERARTGAGMPAISSMRSLVGSTVGIVGAGSTGMALIDLLREWPCRVVVTDPDEERIAAVKGAEAMPLDRLLSESDVVSLHVPLLPETFEMIGRSELALVQDGGLLVNTARGQLVDQAALLEELQSGRLYAAIDVTDPIEPLPSDSPWLKLENCWIFPHIGSSTLDTRRWQSSDVVDDIIRFIRGEPLEHEVTSASWFYRT
jgi:phosphoglycerate dehydrogenase-like enzyme